LRGPTKIESTIRYLGIEVDDALAWRNKLTYEILLARTQQRSHRHYTPFGARRATLAEAAFVPRAQVGREGASRQDELRSWSQGPSQHRFVPEGDLRDERKDATDARRGRP